MAKRIAVVPMATLLSVLPMACASLVHRPLPPKILSCADVGRLVQVRDPFYKALRGRAWVKSKDLTVDLDLSIRHPDRARVEMTGPLGIRVGLLILNEQWIELFVPREKTLFRFPADEMARDTARRDRFLRLLPFEFEPALFVNALVTRVGLNPGETPSCAYDEARNAYRLGFKRGEGSRIVWIDPTTAAPLEALSFARSQADPNSAELRPDWRILYSSLTGAGPATLPAHIELSSATGRKIVFEWVSAEVWDGNDESPFEWQVPPGITIRDY